ncbi:hypothetical protein SLEP1_g15178 [Rubroshorea leprosula]|uniref:Uncharacterized protein n=1 Tax=Rubroshorea leprosula TaxID=152421 RepID=A0AAV5IX03_9ROSI|nr:hypothetical protein SLEP1_g15178 [Rubroshorea leprosula]
MRNSVECCSSDSLPQFLFRALQQQQQRLQPSFDTDSFQCGSRESFKVWSFDLGIEERIFHRG